MKSKLWAIFGLAVVIGVGVYVWEVSRADKGVVSAPAVSNQTDSSKPSGHKWFDNIETPPNVGQKKSEAYVRDADGKPLDLNGMTVSQYVKSLHDAASKGDLKANFNIYTAETICTSIPKWQREIVNMPANGENAYTESLRAIVKQSQEVCGDFNISPRERLEYLHAAAKGGNVKALEMSAMEAPEGIDPTQTADLSDPRVVQWRKDTLDYLTQAATKGSLYAMANLSFMYEQGDVVKQDMSLALTYELAAQLQRHPSADIPDNAPSISRMTSQLSPDQIATARANAAAMIKPLASRNASKRLLL